MPDKEESPAHKFWDTYLSTASEEDQFLPSSWEANTGGVLTFTGLFAATVAAFLIESYRLLSPDSGDQTVLLLRQLLAVTTATTTTIAIPVDVSSKHLSSASFQVAPTAIVVNSLWFASLLISLVCALLSTLIQEWARDYRRDISRRRVLDESSQDRAFNHIYVRMGVDRYGMDKIVYLVTALVHLSVLLFAIGLVIFLFPINMLVASVATGVLGILLAAYAVASVLPLFDASCPYQTPVTYLLVGILWVFIRILPLFVLKLMRKQGRARSLSAVTLRDMMARRAAKHAFFLTPPRFAFAWERTAHSMMGNSKQFVGLLESLNAIEALPSLRYSNDKSRRVWSDRMFFYKLFHHFHPNRFLNPSQTAHPTLYKTVVTLAKSILYAAGERLADHTRAAAPLEVFLNLLYAVARITHVSEDPGERLAAQLCLANVRAHFLDAWRSANRRHIRPLSEDRLFNLLNEGYTGELRYDVLATQAFRPATFLLVMEYQAAVYPSRHDYKFSYYLERWRDATDSSNLIPLHNGSCCRSWRGIFSANGVEHIAASNALTAISNMLEADQAVLCGIEVPKFFDQHRFDMDTERDLRAHPPSEEFVSILRSAGLDEWLVPGSDFTSWPTPGSKHYSFLSEHDGRGIVFALRRFAQEFNWEEYHQVHATANGYSHPPLIRTRTQPRRIEELEPSCSRELVSLRSQTSMSPDVTASMSPDVTGVVVYFDRSDATGAAAEAEDIRAAGNEDALARASVSSGEI